MPDYGLGRLHAPDENDRRFLLPLRREEAKGIVRRSWPAGIGSPLDQGNTPQCVGYSTWAFLTASPVRNHPVFSPTTLYREAQDNDEWPGNDYDGSSVRGAMKALQKRGLVSSYSWAFSCEPAIDHMLTVGPMVLGTLWYDGMFHPDKQGYIWPTGQVVGGHAWLGGIAVDRERKNPDGTVGAIRKLGSWGKRYGQNGRVWIAFHVLDRLIKEQGEAAVATEVLGK